MKVSIYQGFAIQECEFYLRIGFFTDNLFWSCFRRGRYDNGYLQKNLRPSVIGPTIAIPHIRLRRRRICFLFKSMELVSV